MTKRRVKPVPPHRRRYTVSDGADVQAGCTLLDLYPDGDTAPAVLRLRKGAATWVGGGASPPLHVRRTT